MNELALFAGAGGGVLGGVILGWRTVCAVEIDPYARSILLARQDDGTLPPFPVWDEIRTFDGRPWAGRVDVISGGFPCQDISCAGKGAGIGGERSGLWKEFARIIGEVRPRFVFVENSPMLTVRGLGVVLGDLAAMGFDARWCVLGACDAEAPHKRERIWIRAELADAGREGLATRRIGSGQATDGEIQHMWTADRRADVADANRFDADRSRHGAGAVCRERREASGLCDVCHAEEPGLERPESEGNPRAGGCPAEHGQGRRDAGWWLAEPGMGGMADGLAALPDLHGAIAAGNVGRVATGVRDRSARMKCIGNGQVPAAMALAWRTLANEE